MRTPRCSSGSEWPTAPGAYRVHSVFRSALNLAGAGSEPLLSLVADRRFAGPRAAVVAGARFDAWGLAPGAAVGFDGLRLRFAAAAAPVVVLGPARAMPETAPRLDGLDVAAGRAYRSRLGAALAAARAAAGVPDLAAAGAAAATAGALLDWTARLAAAARDLAAVHAAGAPDAFLETAARLIGLGPGLTPAGDDFLVGFLAARRAAAGEEETVFLDAVGPALAALAAVRTTAVSAAFLSSAASGRFAAATLGLVRAAAADLAAAAPGAASCPATLRALGRLATIGHSSGLDAAAGFLCGLAAAVGAAAAGAADGVPAERAETRKAG